MWVALRHENTENDDVKNTGCFLYIAQSALFLCYTQKGMQKVMIKLGTLFTDNYFPKIAV